jgi:hypothetical protein
MEARTLDICVCPQANKVNGTRLFNTPIRMKAIKIDLARGRRWPVRYIQTNNAIAANPTRNVTMVKGGKTLTATPTKKNDPPHRMDSRIRSIQPRGVSFGEIGVEEFIMRDHINFR